MPAKSVAVAVIVFEPWFRVILFAVKVPLETWAGTLVVPTLITTVAWLSSIVPETVIVCMIDVEPFCGDVIAITGAVVSKVMVLDTGTDQLPAMSLNLA